MDKVVYLFRHGEVEEKYKNTYRGVIDCKLCPEGIEMSLRTARFLLAQKVERVLTTGFIRTDIVGQTLAKEGVLHDFLYDMHEMDLGVWEGMEREQVRAQYGEAYARFKSGELDAPIPGSTDTQRQFNARVVAAWQRILILPQKRIGVVAHGGSNAKLLGHIKQTEPTYNQLLGAMNEIHIVDGIARVIRENVDLQLEMQ